MESRTPLRRLSNLQKEMPSQKQIIANGKPIEAALPCSIEEFLVAQNLLPRSVVVTFQLNRVKFIP
jgi:hypothetical protein